MSDPKQSPLITLKGACRHYKMGDETVRALDGLDLELFQGEFISIVGASGSGKSTLLHVLALLDTLSEGQMTLAGHRIDGIDDDALSHTRNRSVGIVFQQFNLLADLSVLENIALPLAYDGMPKEERQERARLQAERVGLSGRLHHTPRELSGGQAQRVAIARALVTNPDVLMADEPTGALDSATGKEIMELFMELHREGKTIIMVTHDAALAEIGTRKITIADGRVLSDFQIKDTPKKTEFQVKAKSSGKLLFKDLLRIGIHEGLLAHKLRTALTMLGVVIGVASVIAMSSFSEGSKKKQEDQIRALGVNLVKVLDKKLEGESLNDARVRGSQGLSREDARILKESIPGVQAMALVREIKMNVIYERGDLPPEISIYGVEGAYAQVNNLACNTGRWFVDDDHLKQNRVIVVGDGLSQKIREASHQEVCGQTLMMGGQIYTIIGTLANRRVDTKDLEIKQIGDANDAILVPLRTLEKRTRFHQLRSEIDEFQFQMESEELLFEAGTTIRRVLGARHRGVEDFDLFIPLDILKAKQQSQKLLDVLSLSICAISLLVGGIGIMNIMLASVSERMKEIGIRRAIGATKGDIRSQFLCESILISFAGSLVGLVLSIFIVIILCSMLALPVVFSLGLIFLSLALAVATGVVFGYTPAKNAAEHNVIEVLRNE